MIQNNFANVLAPASYPTVAAAGTTNADAAAISTQACKVTGADAAKGVILPATVAGLICGDVGETFLVVNNDNAVLKLYPPSGSAINELTATTGAFAIAAKAAVLVVRVSSTQLVAVGKF